jgi:hypothetical protein
MYHQPMKRWLSVRRIARYKELTAYWRKLLGFERHGRHGDASVQMLEKVPIVGVIARMPQETKMSVAKSVCYDPKSEEAWFHRGVYDYADRRQKVVVKIYVDTCELRDLGARRNDLLRFIAHKKAHAKGWEHGEETPKTNAAYYPSVEITGR